MRARGGATGEHRVARDRIGTAVLAILSLSIGLSGACAQRKAPSSSPTPLEHARAETGLASWYGKAHQGLRTASGERFDMHALTAAHRSLPFGTIVRVTELESGRSVKVRINDRGPFRADRILDLSYEAARKLGILERGTARVKITVLAGG
jgi:rare lipoprotein A